MLSSDYIDYVDLVKAFATEGIKASSADETRVHLVFNRNISDKDVELAINAVLAIDARLG